MPVGLHDQSRAVEAGRPAPAPAVPLPRLMPSPTQRCSLYLCRGGRSAGRCERYEQQGREQSSQPHEGGPQRRGPPDLTDQPAKSAAAGRPVRQGSGGIRDYRSRWRGFAVAESPEEGQHKTFDRARRACSAFALCQLPATLDGGPGQRRTRWERVKAPGRSPATIAHAGRLGPRLRLLCATFQENPGKSSHPGRGIVQGRQATAPPGRDHHGPTRVIAGDQRVHVVTERHGGVAQLPDPRS